jgi:hypothetical protein
MRTMIVAAALAMGMGTAVAQSNLGANGNGPAAPITPFTIWSMQSQTGKRMIPTAELMRMAHHGLECPCATGPRGKPASTDHLSAGLKRALAVPLIM